MDKHPRDRFITVCGRKPVLEALSQKHLNFGELLIYRKLNRELRADIVDRAQSIGVKVTFCELNKVNRRSKNPKQDQGVALDIETPDVNPLEAWTKLREDGTLFIPDGVTTPANLGMMIRSVAASGLSGIVLPERNAPSIGPLVIKASAGTIFHCPILKSTDTVSAIKVLKAAGWRICALDARGEMQLFKMAPHPKTAWVFGNESKGISSDVHDEVDHWVSIPMSAEVESLNVAMTATVVAFEIVRQRLCGDTP